MEFTRELHYRNNKMNSLYCNTFLSCVVDIIVPHHHITPLRDTIIPNIWIFILTIIISVFKLNITLSNRLKIAKLIFNQIIIVLVGTGFLSQYWIFANMLIDMLHAPKNHLLIICSYPYEKLSTLLFTYFYWTVTNLCDSPYLDDVQDIISLGHFYQSRPIYVTRQHFALTYLFSPTVHVFWFLIYLSSITENRLLSFIFICQAIVWFISTYNLLKTASLILTLLEMTIGFRLPADFIDEFNSASLFFLLTRDNNAVYNITLTDPSEDQVVTHLTRRIAPLIVRFILRSQPNGMAFNNNIVNNAVNNTVNDFINNRNNENDLNDFINNNRQPRITLFQQRCHELVISDMARFRTTTTRTDHYFSKDDLINYFQQRWSTTITNWSQPSKYHRFLNWPQSIDDPTSIQRVQDSSTSLSDNESDYEIHYINNNNESSYESISESSDEIHHIDNYNETIIETNTTNNSENVLKKKKTYEKEFRLTYVDIYKMLEREPNEVDDEEFEIFLKKLFFRHKLETTTSNTIPCIICDDAPRDVLNLPCKHLVSCTSCSAMQLRQQCAICKGIVLQTLQIHIS